MTLLGQWLEELRAGRLGLGDLVERINQRGAIDPAQHLQELAELDAGLLEQRLDERLHRALRTKLAGIQMTAAPPPPPPPPSAEDRTIFAPKTPPSGDDFDPFAATIAVPASQLLAPPPEPAPAPLPANPDTPAFLETVMSERALPPPTPPPAKAPPPAFLETVMSERIPLSPPSPEKPEPPAFLETVMSGSVIPPPPAKPTAPAFLETVMSPASLLPSPPPSPPRDSTMMAPEPNRQAPQPDRGGHTGTRTGSTGSTSGISAASWQRLSESDELAEMQVNVGSRLKDRFVLEKVIGRGGMGVVYLAVDERKVEARDRNPRIAVKVLNPEFRRHPDSLVALQREARRSQQLAHDNIVRVYDFDKDGGVVYMTMEYVDGEDLKTLIRSYGDKGMPLADALPIIEGMSLALGRAHRDGIVHSDFKPGNVMLTKERIAKVFDFGIARAGKHRTDVSGEQTVFDAGSLGALTPAYASLEMLRGMDPEPADDLYGLACVIYEMLAGRHPFDKLNAEQALQKKLSPVRIPGLTNRQWQALKSGLALQRVNRIASAEALLDGLRPRSSRERALPYVLAGVAAVVALIAAGSLIRGAIYDGKVESVENCIANGECAQAEQFAGRLTTLDAADQSRIRESRLDEIKGIFYKSLQQHWSPDQARYDYAEASKVVALAAQLYGGDSAWATAMRDELDASRNSELSRLNDAFNAQIDGDVFTTPAGDRNNLLNVLSAVRAIDSQQNLLRDGRIAVAFERGIRQSLNDSSLQPLAQLELARSRIEQVRPYLADSSALRPLENELQSRSDQIAATAKDQTRRAQAVEQRQQRLDQLALVLAEPASTPGWGDKLRKSFVAAREAVPEGDLDLAGLADSMTAAIISRSQEIAAGNEVEPALEVIGLGLELLPGDARLEREFARLGSARDRAIAQARSAAERTQLQLQRLDSLLDKPIASNSWVGEVQTSFKSLAAAPDDTELLKRRDRLASAAERLVDESAQADFERADDLAIRLARIDPADARLTALAGRVAAARSRAASDRVGQLTSLVQQKSFTPDWQKAVERAVAGLRGSTDLEATAALAALAGAYTERADQLTTEKSFAAARQIALAGSRLLPQSADLRGVLTRIDQMERQELSSRDEQQGQFKVQELERTVSLKAAAGEISSAVTALRDLRKLDPGNAFAKGGALQEIEDGSLRQAQRFADQKKFETAVKTIDRALSVNRSPVLEQARLRHEIAGCTADLDREQGQRGSLSDARRILCLSVAQQNDRNLYQKYQALEAPAPAAVTVPSAAAEPERDVPVAAAPTAPAVQPAAPRGPDPCRKDMAGKGSQGRHQCSDDLGGGANGPVLVVVEGAKFYAITRNEISVAEFGQFCRDSAQCSARGGNQALPMNEISSDQARAYAKWLSARSGRSYRLPTEAEWTNAAGADGRDVFLIGNCSRGAPLPAGNDETNAWGLANAIGNLWEMTDNGGSIVLRGASYLDKGSNCDIEARRAYGGPHPTVGLRLVRDMGR